MTILASARAHQRKPRSAARATREAGGDKKPIAGNVMCKITDPVMIRERRPVMGMLSRGSPAEGRHPGSRKHRTHHGRRCGNDLGHLHHAVICEKPRNTRNGRRRQGCQSESL